MLCFLFHQYGITYAVDATNLEKPKRIDGVEYLDARVEDTVAANINIHFDAVCDFIDRAKTQVLFLDFSANTNLLSEWSSCYFLCGRCEQECVPGHYVPSFEGESQFEGGLLCSEPGGFSDRVTVTLQIRPIISPNIGFWRQMIDEEQKKRGEASVQLLRGRTPRPVPDVYLHRTLTYNA